MLLVCQPQVENYLYHLAGTYCFPWSPRSSDPREVNVWTDMTQYQSMLYLKGQVMKGFKPTVISY